MLGALPAGMPASRRQLLQTSTPELHQSVYGLQSEGDTPPWAEWPAAYSSAQQRWRAACFSAHQVVFSPSAPSWRELVGC